MDSFVNSCPVLPDGFIGWVVLREARSLRFAWALMVSHLPLLFNLVCVPILKFNGVFHHCDHGLFDGLRHLGQSFLRVTSRFLVRSLGFACASAVLGVSVHVGLSFAGSSSFSAQES